MHADKLQTIAELIEAARRAAMNPRGNQQRHLTCAICGQMYDKTDPAHVTHHDSEPHLKWAP